MPIIKSAKKRMQLTEVFNARNTSARTKLKNAVKKYNAAIEAKDIETAEKLLPETVSAIKKACTFGIITKNSASRKEAHVSKALSDLQKAAVNE